MELAPVPRRRSWSSSVWVVVAAVVLTPVTLLALVPTSFGLERYVVADDTLVPGVARGSVALERTVPVGDVAPGDVVTFSDADPTQPAATADGSDLVTARVEQVRDGVLWTRNQEPGPGRELAGLTTVSRVVVAVPLVGYPFLGALGRDGFAVASLLAGLLLGGALVVGAGRRGAAPRTQPGYAGSATGGAPRR